MEQFWDIIISSSITTVILFIWFETHATVEYLTVVDKTFSLFTNERNETLEEYAKQKKIAPSLSFPEFLLSEKPNFFTKLISCPICLAFWTCLFVVILCSRSLNLYPASLIASLFMYFKLVRVTNE